MIKEAENIILTKQYYELSADELATVSELVANAEEFEDMKWFWPVRNKPWFLKKLKQVLT